MKYLMFTTKDLEGVANILVLKWWTTYCNEEMQVIAVDKNIYKKTIIDMLNKIEERDNKTDKDRLKSVEEIILTFNPGDTTVTKLSTYKFGHKITISKMWTNDRKAISTPKKLMNHFIWGIPFGDGHGHQRTSQEVITERLSIMPNLLRVISLIDNYLNKKVIDRVNLVKYHSSPDGSNGFTPPLIVVAPGLFYTYNEDPEFLADILWNNILGNNNDSGKSELFTDFDKKVSAFQLLKYEKYIAGLVDKIKDSFALSPQKQTKYSSMIVKVDHFVKDSIAYIVEEQLEKSDIFDKVIIFSENDDFNIFGERTLVCAVNKKLENEGVNIMAEVEPMAETSEDGKKYKNMVSYSSSAIFEASERFYNLVKREYYK